MDDKFGRLVGAAPLVHAAAVERDLEDPECVLVAPSPPGVDRRRSGGRFGRRVALGEPRGDQLVELGVLAARRCRPPHALSRGAELAPADPHAVLHDVADPEFGSELAPRHAVSKPCQAA